MKNAKIREKKYRTNTGSTYLSFRVTHDQANLASDHLRASAHATARLNTEFRTRTKVPGVLPTISHPFSIFSRRSYILLVHSPVEYTIDLFCSKDENLMDFRKVLSRRNVLNVKRKRNENFQRFLRSPMIRRPTCVT